MEAQPEAAEPAAAFAAYWAGRTGRAWELREARRIYGGASRETWLLGLRDADSGEEQRLVYRRVQDNALIDTEARVEFAALESVQGRGLPVPRPLALVEDAGALGRPFAVLEALPGAAANPFAVDPYGDQAQAVGRRYWRHLGEIAAIPVDSAMPLARCLHGGRLPDPAACYMRELEHWRAVIREDAMGAEPVLELGMAWLEANLPPPPPRLALVHGDYRTGNLLFEDSSITAILDWEMAHLGDPLEDVAWGASRLWSPHAPHPPGGMVPLEEGLRLWSEASGLEADLARLRWWQVLACVKGLGIWISAGREFLEGRNTDPVNLFSSWVCTSLHNRELLDLLAEEIAA